MLVCARMRAQIVPPFEFIEVEYRRGVHRSGRVVRNHAYPESCQEAAVVALAGPFAEERVRHGGRWSLRTVAGEDYAQALRVIMGSQRSDIDTAADNAARLVREHWTTVLALARHLQIEPRLTYERALAVIAAQHIGGCGNEDKSRAAPLPLPASPTELIYRA